MQSIKNFIVLTLGVTVSLLAASLLTGQPASAVDKKEPRAFYLTTTEHTGDQPLMACAAGFHMASLWEIHDSSNLAYDSTLGFVHQDSGSGPPDFPGWIRTGGAAILGGNPGQANCGAWGSANASHRGTIVSFPFEWSSTSELQPVNPWVASTRTCDNGVRVWCVED